MRLYLLVKTLLRSPVKTSLTFLLLAAVTFALFSRVAEYSITSREINNAAKEYRAVGSAEIAPASETHPGFPYYIYADPRMLQDSSKEKRENYLKNFRYQPLSLEQIGSILELPYITSSSVRYMTAGVSDKYYRLDDGEEYYNYTMRYVIEGTLSEVNYNTLYAGAYNNELTLTDCTLLAGDPFYLPKNREITFHAYSKDVGSFGIGSRIAIMYDDNYIYDTDYIKNLIIGDRYVFIGRFEPLGDPVRFFLSDHLTNTWCEAIQSVEGQPESYLESEQFSSLNELIELTNSDLHTFDVVYTDDMFAIMRLAEGNMVVTSGRRLTKEDNANGSSVCVISSNFASRNNLNIGHKITLKLGAELFEQYKGLGAVAATHERYSPLVKTVELEIVGIYMDTDSKRKQLQKPHWSYSINTVFVPKSLLPLDERKLDDQVFSPSEFSFTLGNAWDIPSFIEQVAPKFKKMGLKLIFYDDGWPDIVEQFKITKALSGIEVVVLFGAIVAATGFIVFLFITRKKKEYAIMRALGTTRKESAKALILPLIALTVTSVFIGSCVAWIYTTNTVAKNDALLKIEGYVVSTTIPVITAIGCIIGEILLVLLFALFGLWRIESIPPLMLLRDNPNKQVRNRKHMHSNIREKGNGKPTGIETRECVESITHFATFGLNISNVSREPYSPASQVSDYSLVNDSISAALRDMTVKINFRRATGQSLRHVTRHILRSTRKSMLSIFLSALLIGAVGQFVVMRQSYVDLCNSTVIKVKLINGSSLTTVTQILKTGYVINPYYEYKNAVNFNNSKADLVITNDIERYTGEEAEITYAEGYDASYMKELGKVCIVGSKLLEENGLKLGDKVHVTGTEILNILQSAYINKYRSEYPEEDISDERILELYKDKIAKEFMNEGLFYTITGFVTTPSGKYDRIFFTPGTLRTSPIFGFEAPLDLAEFTLSDNLRADEFRNYVGMATGGITGEYSSNRLSFIMDTSKIENLLNTLKLLGRLFPVIVAATVLIGGLVCGLIITQTAKETAILRVLGTTRRRTCAILVIEQVVLCMAGLAAGACGLFLYNGLALTAIVSKLYVFTALYFIGCLAGSIISALLTTRRKVLELLQTKE